MRLTCEKKNVVRSIARAYILIYVHWVPRISSNVCMTMHQKKARYIGLHWKGTTRQRNNDMHAMNSITLSFSHSDKCTLMYLAFVCRCWIHNQSALYWIWNVRYNWQHLFESINECFNAFRSLKRNRKQLWHGVMISQAMWLIFMCYHILVILIITKWSFLLWNSNDSVGEKKVFTWSTCDDIAVDDDYNKCSTTFITLVVQHLNTTHDKIIEWRTKV